MPVEYWFLLQMDTSTIQYFKSLYHGMATITIPVVNILTNSLPIVVAVPTNISMKLLGV